RLLALAAPLPAETVSLVDAGGRWAAADIRAGRDQPACALSSMDGYAIRHADLPGPWTLAGESAAGRGFAGAIAPGQAVRIFAGAPVRAGADAVLIQEDAARDGDRLMLSGPGPAGPGENIRPRASDFGVDTVLMTASTLIDARHVALAALGGHGA